MKASFAHPREFRLHLQNHDVTKPDAQQTFRLMHYFSVEGKEFPEDFPRVMLVLPDMHHAVYYSSELLVLFCCTCMSHDASQLQARAMLHVVIPCARARTQFV